MEAKDLFDVAFSAQGQVAGPLLRASMIVPFGMGFVFQDGAGNAWQLRLAQNADGTLYVGPDGKPTVELIQVAI